MDYEGVEVKEGRDHNCTCAAGKHVHIVVVMRLALTSLICACFLVSWNVQWFVQSRATDIRANVITSNLEEWETDLAIMAYVPWCKYCKQLGASWDQIAILQQDNKNLAVVKLNCEGSSLNEQMCGELDVDRYPSVYFIGYGDYNQGNKGKIFARSSYKQIVKWTADLRPEAIYDWMRMLSFFSWTQRSWDNLKDLFSGAGKSRADKKYKKLYSRMKAMEYNMTLYASELEKYKAIEIFDSLEDYGDPFPLLSKLEPDEKNLPLRYCISDLAKEYCKYSSKEETFCSMVPACAKIYFENAKCRPETSPFNDRGTRVLSSCLRPEVLEQYKAGVPS